MIYRNIETTYEIPVKSGRGELAELAALLLKAGFVVIMILLAMDRLALWLAPRTPFSWEERLASSLEVTALDVIRGQKLSASDERIESALQQRVNTLAALSGFPAGMPLHVHYVASDTVNAFATLGGNMFMFRGLLEKIRYEEELDAVLAHEMGHIHERHVIRQLSRGVMALGALSAMKISSSAIDRWVLGDANSIAMLAHSRADEKEADDFAIAVVEKRYGHAAGMESLLAVLAQQEQAQDKKISVEWLQSHPDTQSRIDAAHQADNPALAGSAMHALTPLSRVFRGSQG